MSDRKEYLRQWYQRNKERIKANYNPERQRQQVERFHAFLDAHRTSCLFCGSTSSTGHSSDSLQFHHVNPLEKTRSINKMRGVNRKDVQKELDKCWCLCWDCHQKLHNRLVDPLPETYELRCTDDIA